MNTTNEYLDALKLKLGAPSDYALAPKIGVTRSAISKYRTQKDFFSDEMCLRVASILEVESYLVLAAVHVERARTTEEKTAWTTVFEKLSSVAAMCLLATGISALQPAPVQAAQVSNADQDIYIMRNKRRQRKAPAKAKIDLSYLVQNLVSFG